MCKGQPFRHPSSSLTRGSLSLPSTMRVLAAALAVLLLVAICSLAEADLNISTPVKRSAALLKNVAEAPTCCFSYISHRIPRRIISSAYMTSNLCGSPGVVLITRKGRHLCANPSADWVQKYLKDLELQE
ncbi:C-C motif chemokine 3-like isoform X1 [Serinus canaria]|uniref:C-C motif chemokine 3-like isoform X1 n=1 Tax=Serinus canaria TaxID=9135 RepID=UPI0021CCC91C|nr:C-C motif chemokine 3-like isoform X1 [Serinus canaria]